MNEDGWDDGLSGWFEVAARHDGDNGVTTWIPVRRDLVDEQGRLRLGALAFGVDCAVGICAGWSAMPDWVVTSDLDMRFVGPATVGPVRSSSTLVRRGRGQVLVEARMVDEGAGDAPVAIATANHTILPPDLGSPIDVMAVGHIHRQPRLAVEPRPMSDHFGVQVVDRGVVELAMARHTFNPWGIMHGALHALLAEDATRSLVAGVVTNATVRFVSPVRIGPARATATVAGRYGDQTVVRAEVRDTGAGDRVSSLAMLTVQPDW
ncbi:MAG TPA: PaaI family thioesterase [Acidimicrobiales bacterium]|nr:PaaI family thioesterase [Acidimicrobiales bacterium]